MFVSRFAHSDKKKTRKRSPNCCAIGIEPSSLNSLLWHPFKKKVDLLHKGTSAITTF